MLLRLNPCANLLIPLASPETATAIIARFATETPNLARASNLSSTRLDLRTSFPYRNALFCCLIANVELIIFASVNRFVLISSKV